MSCGGDGLVKLWNVATCACVHTFDEHEDRIWSIAFAGEHERFMASGGSDSMLVIWEDTTEQDRELDVRQRQEELAKEQHLSNAIQVGDLNRRDAWRFRAMHCFSLGIFDWRRSWLLDWSIHVDYWRCLRSICPEMIIFACSQPLWMA